MSAHAHLTICFGPGGGIDFYPDADADKEAIVAGLTRVVEILHDDPDAIRCAAGACDGTCGHGYGWSRA